MPGKYLTNSDFMPTLQTPHEDWSVLTRKAQPGAHKSVWGEPEDHAHRYLIWATRSFLLHISKAPLARRPAEPYPDEMFYP